MKWVHVELPGESSQLQPVSELESSNLPCSENDIEIDSCSQRRSQPPDRRHSRLAAARSPPFAACQPPERQDIEEKEALSGSLLKVIKVKHFKKTARVGGSSCGWPN